MFIIPSPTSVVKGSPDPNASKLFAEFMVGDDAQKIFPADGGYSVRTDIAPPAGSPDLKSLKIIAVDEGGLIPVGKRRARPARSGLLR